MRRLARLCGHLGAVLAVAFPVITFLVFIYIAAMVFLMCASVCAPDRNHASNCDGGR